MSKSRIFYIAVCRSVSQCDAVCSMSRSAMLQCVAVYSMLQCVAVCCSVSQCDAVCSTSRSAERASYQGRGPYLMALSSIVFKGEGLILWLFLPLCFRERA